MNRREFLAAGAVATLTLGARRASWAADAAAGQTGETLYNGITLPAPWPPRLTKPLDTTAPPPYAASPPAVIPIDVGRQLFVDDFLIESTTLTRTFHRPTPHPKSPVLRPDQPSLLNDAAFIEFAKAMAGRLLREAPGDDASRIEFAFRLATSRKPRAEELKVLTTMLAKQRTAFAANRGEATALAGDSPPAGAKPGEFASWVVVCRVILNLDESITRE